MEINKIFIVLFFASAVFAGSTSVQKSIPAKIDSQQVILPVQVIDSLMKKIKHADSLLQKQVGQTSKSSTLTSVKGANNQFWASFTAVISGLILFSLTLIKDLFFHKKKDASERNKYRFEKTHDRAMQISEEFIIDLCNLLSEIQEYKETTLKGTTLIKPQKNIEESIHMINKEINNLQKKCNYAELYIDREIVNGILEVTGDLNHLYAMNSPEQWKESFDKKTEIERQIKAIIKQLKLFLNGNTA